MSETRKFRLLTRSDFDGLVCAILLKELDILGEIKFVHPKDMQDGKVEVTENDILTNLPYVEGCHLCFDHHTSEETRNADESHENHVLVADADSAARVVYDYYGGKERFPEIADDMMTAVDKARVSGSAPQNEHLSSSPPSPNFATLVSCLRWVDTSQLRNGQYVASAASVLDVRLACRIRRPGWDRRSHRHGSR